MRLEISAPSFKERAWKTPIVFRESGADKSKRPVAAQRTLSGLEMAHLRAEEGVAGADSANKSLIQMRRLVVGDRNWILDGEA
jgi:hypothetical protein